MNQKGGALVGLADETDAAAMLFNATLGHAQSQTMAGLSIRVRGPKEWFENAGLVLDRYPDALIADFNAVPFRRLGQADHNRSIRILQAIGEHVLQRVAQAWAIGNDGVRTFVTSELQAPMRLMIGEQ
jgi:hypothetical protein